MNHLIYSIFFILLYFSWLCFGQSISPGTLSVQGTNFENCQIFEPEVGHYYKLYWTISSGLINLGIEALASDSAGWLGMGVQTNPPPPNNNYMVGADISICFQGGTLHDYNGPNVTNGPPSLDPIQSVTLNQMAVVNGIFGVEFHRAYPTTSDPTDKDFSGTHTLIYAMNDQAGVDGTTNGEVTWNSYHTIRYFALNFSFDVPSPSCELPGILPDPDCELSINEPLTFNITFPAYNVMPVETQYVCLPFTLPTDQKYQAMRFDPIIDNPSVVHHMIIYQCTVPLNQTLFQCTTMPNCVNIFYAWAVGGPEFCTPSICGIPFGNGSTTVSYILQIHYNNPGLRSGIIDSSGVMITYSSTLRQYDAGFVMLGVPINQIAIPAGNPYYHMSNTCPSSQTQGLGSSEIIVFASGLHAHYYGRQLWTEQYRNGAFIGYIGQNTQYSFNAQSLAKLHPYMNITGGDQLVTHCVWDTTTANSTIYGGESSENEMCFNFLVYYPLIPSVASCIGTSQIIPGVTTQEQTTAQPSSNTGITGSNSTPVSLASNIPLVSELCLMLVIFLSLFF